MFGFGAGVCALFDSDDRRSNHVDVRSFFVSAALRIVPENEQRVQEVPRRARIEGGHRQKHEHLEPAVIDVDAGRNRSQSDGVMRFVQRFELTNGLLFIVARRLVTDLHAVGPYATWTCRRYKNVTRRTCSDEC